MTCWSKRSLVWTTYTAEQCLHIPQWGHTPVHKHCEQRQTCFPSHHNSAKRNEEAKGTHLGLYQQTKEFRLQKPVSKGKIFRLKMPNSSSNQKHGLQHWGGQRHQQSLGAGFWLNYKKNPTKACFQFRHYSQQNKYPQIRQWTEHFELPEANVSLPYYFFLRYTHTSIFTCIRYKRLRKNKYSPLCERVAFLKNSASWKKLRISSGLA